MCVCVPAPGRPCSQTGSGPAGCPEDQALPCCVPVCAVNLVPSSPKPCPRPSGRLVLTQALSWAAAQGHASAGHVPQGWSGLRWALAASLAHPLLLGPSEPPQAPVLIPEVTLRSPSLPGWGQTCWGQLAWDSLEWTGLAPSPPCAPHVRLQVTVLSRRRWCGSGSLPAARSGCWGSPVLPVPSWWGGPVGIPLRALLYSRVVGAALHGPGCSQGPSQAGCPVSVPSWLPA